VRIIVLLILLFAFTSIKGQDSYEPSNWAFRGYLKNMSTFSWSPLAGDTLWYDNLTHNRLNLAWYPNDNFSFYVEMRNQLFTGSNVKNFPPDNPPFPSYGELIDGNNDFFDLSWNVIDNENVVLNMMFDRMFVRWVKNDWEIKLGRQRINWGVNLAWNPNDLFNAYSFFDFDYEERPGSDALRVTYYTGVASSIEVAAKIADSHDKFVAASMYKMNVKNYDLQFLGGVANGDVSLGTGWAGNLGLASIKGELTCFIPFTETAANTNYLSNPLTGVYILDSNGNRIKVSERYSTMFLGAISIDYSFPNSLYLNGSVMYNSIGDYKANLFSQSLGQQYSTFTVRDLSPYPWSAFISSNYQFSPLLYGGVSVIFYPGTNNFFINPLLTYSIVQNLDIDLVGQLFFGTKPNESYDAISKALFARIKWSF
jgi:hypothetical protein